MLQKYERKAEDIIEKLAHEEPNERNFKMLAEALVITAGGKIMGAMDSGREHYDGRMGDYYRGQRRTSSGRYRYDGMDRRMDTMHDGGDREYWDDDMDDDDDYYDGRGVSRRDGRRRGARKNISGGVK